MPCKWKKQGFSSGDACVAKMTGKVDDPEAYCYGEAEAYRHRDFQRIYSEFVNYYKDTVKGESEYYSWLKALNLNEEREYGQAQESFRWAKDMLQYLREDDQYKYYKVLVGFPIRSMNGNVYKERDLVAAALKLDGLHPNLNHKDQWHFTPESRWGEITAMGGRLEDGAIETILRVSKKAICPICNGKSMTELIDTKRIVNVSLQGGCSAQGFGGVCDGFQFDDKGFSLLTNDVLPGIPMARIFPLEHIMVEALQVDETNNKRRKKKVKKLEMQIIEDEEPEIKPGSRYCDDHPDDPRCKAHKKAIHGEDAEPCPEGERRNPETGECEPIPEEEQFPTVDITPEVPKPSVEPDEHGQCPEGKRLNALGKCVATEECGEGRHWDANANKGQGGCVADTPPKPEHPETAHGLPAAPREDMLSDGPTEQPTAGEQPPMLNPPKLPPPPAAGEQPAVTGDAPEPETPMSPTAPGEIEPKPPHDCPNGHHYDPDLDQCVPDSPITERVQRFQAEDQADNLKTKVAKWEKRYIEMDSHNQRLRGKMQAQNQRINRLEKQVDAYNIDKVNDGIHIKDAKRRIEDLTIARDDYKHSFEKLQRIYNEQDKKYKETMDVNLELVHKLTKRNEDYMAIASKYEMLKAQMNKAKSISKKITRLKT